MLSIFPQILFLSPLSATLLRIAIAITFAYIAWRQYQNRTALSQVRFPVVGGGMWVVWFAAVVEVVLALFILFGLFTQIAAILTAIASLKFLYWSGKASSFSPISRGTALLLFVISLSLIVTGAGLFTFDLPL